MIYMLTNLNIMKIGMNLHTTKKLSEKTNTKLTSQANLEANSCQITRK